MAGRKMLGERVHLSIHQAKNFVLNGSATHMGIN